MIEKNEVVVLTTNFDGHQDIKLLSQGKGRKASHNTLCTVNSFYVKKE